MSAHGLAVLAQISTDYNIPGEGEQDVVAFLTSVSSFTNLSDPWTCESSQRISLQLLETFLNKCDLKGRSSALSIVLQRKIKPAFSKARGPADTEQARKAINSLPIDSSATDELDATIRPWKYHYPYIVTVFGWIIGTLSRVEVCIIISLPCCQLNE